MPAGALEDLLQVFYDEKIGGVTPDQKIFNGQPLLRRMSNWLEDNRFNEVVKGQSRAGAVSCLPGRLFALRTKELKAAVPFLITQKFLGMKCISGDDRFLTSWLLSHGYKTVFQNTSVVYTDAPDTLKELVKQRLRWSRGSMRGTIFALPWLWRYPYTFFMVVQNVLMRWFMFLMLLDAFVLQSIFTVREHWLWLENPGLYEGYSLLIIGVISLFLGGLLKKIRHIYNHPQDFFYYPVFMVITMFILTPLEWYGNLTCWKQGWLTRSKSKSN